MTTVAERAWQLREEFTDNHPDYTIVDWQIAAGCGDTVLGYWEWVVHQIEANEDLGEPEPKSQLYALTPAQHATVLAALRHYQEHLQSPRAFPTFWETIATNDGTFKPLTANDIDDLCQDLNHSGLAIGDVVNILGSDNNPIVTAARNHRLLEEGTLELDGTPVVSYSGPYTACVMAWLHINLEEK